jgi:hypothetical protein
MHVLKNITGTSFDSTSVFWDSTVLTLDSNSAGTYFVVIPSKPMNSTVSGRFFNELTRETATLSLTTEQATRGTFRVFVDYSDFTEKATYEFWLYNGSVEVYRGKLYAFLGATQNYSVYENE